MAFLAPISGSRSCFRFPPLDVADILGQPMPRARRNILKIPDEAHRLFRARVTQEVLARKGSAKSASPQSLKRGKSNLPSRYREDQGPRRPKADSDM